MPIAFPISTHRMWTANLKPSAVRSGGPQPTKRILGLVFALAAAALAISLYLAWAGLTTSRVAGCGLGGVFDCDHVLSSKWARWMGIPVGIGASVLYSVAVAMAGLLALRPTGRVSRIASSVLVSLGIAAGLCALWFVSLQVFVIQHLCPWCLAAHACGLCLAGIVIWLKPLGTAFPKLPTALAVAGTAILIAGQVMAEAPKTYVIQHFDSAPVEGDGGADGVTATDAESEVFAAPVFEAPVVDERPDQTETATENAQTEQPSAVTPADEPTQAGLPPLLAVILIFTFLHSGTGSGLTWAQETGKSIRTVSNADVPEVTFGQGTRLRLTDWPLLGSTDAEYVFVEMFDYTCPHCREAHQNIVRRLKQKYGRELAIVALSVPLNSRCNAAVASTSSEHRDACELAELSVAVWRAQPERFAEFHDWLMDGATTRTASDARRQAERLVGPDALEKVLGSSVCKAYISKHVELYRSVGAGAIPKFLFRNTALVGRVDSPEAISQILERDRSAQ